MSANPTNENSYLQQVLADQAELEADLRVRKRKASEPLPEPAAPAAMRASRSLGFGGGGGDADFAVDFDAPGYAAQEARVTGALWWKTVVVPPNAFVVHTRRGHDKPLHIGLGVSFRFNPRTDAFLVVPSAMQTILIRARCICKERQGLVVQGYLQWSIDDFETAYHRLDFSDEAEPMRLVNLQLREQAEAAIKDTVATMGIDEVLTDKQPIIEELTARLRKVAEGTEAGDRGLGLRIVTVQIKEAVVCSQSVWETLQRPFRAERRKQARLQELEHEERVRAREAEVEETRVRERMATEAEIQRLEAEARAEAFSRSQRQRVREAEEEAEVLATTKAHAQDKADAEHELARQAQLHALELARLGLELDKLRAQHEIEVEGARRAVHDPHSQAALQMALIERLPELAQALPQPERLHQLRIGDDLWGQATQLLSALTRPASGPAGEDAA